MSELLLKAKFPFSQCKDHNEKFNIDCLEFDLQNHPKKNLMRCIILLDRNSNLSIDTHTHTKKREKKLKPKQKKQSIPMTVINMDNLFQFNYALLVRGSLTKNTKITVNEIQLEATNTKTRKNNILNYSRCNCFKSTLNSRRRKK